MSLSTNHWARWPDRASLLVALIVAAVVAAVLAAQAAAYYEEFWADNQVMPKDQWLYGPTAHHIQKVNANAIDSSAGVGVSLRDQHNNVFIDPITHYGVGFVSVVYSGTVGIGACTNASGHSMTMDYCVQKF